MRKFRHLTPLYVLFKIRSIVYQKRHPQNPWLTPMAIQILRWWLKPYDKGVEWGSGRSTIWFARRVAHILSIEHNRVWYEKTFGQIEKAGLLKAVDYRLLPVDSPKIRLNEKLYVEAVNDYPDGSFDFALVDGRLRHLCMAIVLPKIRPGGLLILDNSERYIHHDGQTKYCPDAHSSLKHRDEWQALLSDLSGWRTIATNNGIWHTRFWIKPC